MGVGVAGADKGGDIRLPEGGGIVRAQERDVEVKLELANVEVSPPPGEEEILAVNSWGNGKVICPRLSGVGLGEPANVAGNNILPDHGVETFEVVGIRLKEPGSWVGRDDLVPDSLGSVWEVDGNVVLDIGILGEERAREENSLISGVADNDINILPVFASLKKGAGEVGNVIVVDGRTESELAVLGGLNDSLVSSIKNRGALSPQASKTLTLASSSLSKLVKLSVELSAGVDGLESRALKDGTFEERVNGTILSNQVVHDGTGTSRLAHDGNLSLVTTDKADVALDPLEGSTLVE